MGDILPVESATVVPQCEENQPPFHSVTVRLLS